jgi:hypothetical protein
MSWKRRTKILVGVMALLTLGAVAFVVFMADPILNLLVPMTRQMRAGREYMDALTDAEIQKWIDRSKEYLADVDPKEDPIGARQVPPDLQALGIVRIDLRPHAVVYLWAGGLDHTCLVVTDANEVIARYDDHHSKVIWPKQNANRVPATD